MILFDQLEGRNRHQTERLSDQGVRSSMLLMVSVTSGRIFSAVEAKLTSHAGLLPATWPTDATINRRYHVRYRVDILAYSHSDRFGPLRILSCCYYY